MLEMDEVVLGMGAGDLEPTTRDAVVSCAARHYEHSTTRSKPRHKDESLEKVVSP